MHKFTIFTIIFSVVVVITVGELVVHDYLERHDDKVEVSVEEEAQPEENVAVEVESEDEVIVAEQDMPEVDMTPYLTGLDYASFGFAEGVELREKDFMGVFTFLQYESSASEPYYWEIFEGEEYAAGIYEIICENPTEAFTVYTDLRESGVASENGDVNEVNIYGEASFYFNHSTKTTTIYKVILGEDRVWAFTYAHKYHDPFKGVFEVLG